MFVLIDGIQRLNMYEGKDGDTNGGRLMSRANIVRDICENLALIASNDALPKGPSQTGLKPA